jgi:hypothetical protein
MGDRQNLNLEKRFKKGFVLVYPDKPLEGEERRKQNQRIFEAVKAVLTGILKREPTPDELSGCKPLTRKRY